MKITRVLSIVLVLISLVACGKKKSSSAPAPQQTQQVAPAQAPKTEEDKGMTVLGVPVPEVVQPKGLISSGILNIGGAIMVEYEWQMNSGPRDAGDYGHFIIWAKAGQEYIIESSAVGSALYLFNRFIKPVGKDDDGKGMARIEFAPTRNDVYSIKVRAMKPGQKGITLLSFRNKADEPITKPTPGKDGVEKTTDTDTDTVTVAPAAARTGRRTTYGVHMFGMPRSGAPTKEEPQALQGADAVAIGGEHTLLIRGGYVWTIGSNQHGQLGRGKTTQELPQDLQQGKVTALDIMGITQVAAGQFHSVALRNDGTVWTWGGNISGQLGYETPVAMGAGAGMPFNLEPRKVAALDKIIVVEIAAGANFTMARDTLNRVWVWGSNDGGALGLGTTEKLKTPSKPVEVTVLQGSTAIAAGFEHALAVRGGRVYAWGGNNQGQLGLGSGDANDHPTPTLVPGLSGVVDVGAGLHHSVAWRGDEVLTWGANVFGQLGITPPDKDVHATPGAIAGVSEVDGIEVRPMLTIIHLAKGQN